MRVWTNSLFGQSEVQIEPPAMWTYKREFAPVADADLDPIELPDDQLVPDNTDPLPDEGHIRTDPVEPEEE